MLRSSASHRMLLPTLYPWQQIDFRAVGEFGLPAVAVDFAVDRDGDAAGDVGGHAGVVFLELAEQLADGFGVHVNDGGSARGGAERSPEVDVRHC